MRLLKNRQTRAAVAILVTATAASMVWSQGVAAPAPSPIHVAAGLEPANTAPQQAARTHLWVVRQRGGGAFALLHRTSDDPPGDLYEVFADGKGKVEAVAAHGRVLYTFFASGAAQSLEYLAFPPPQHPYFQATQLSSLPKDATPLQATAWRGGPIVLIRNSPAAGVVIQDPQPPLKLLRLAGPQWVEETIPAAIQPDRVRGLAVLGETADALAIIEVNAAGDGLVIHRSGPMGWTEQPVTTRVTDDARFLTVWQNGAAHLLMVQPGRAGTDKPLEAMLLRENGSSTFPFKGELILTMDRWWALGAGDELSIFTADGGGAIRSARIAFPAGEASAWTPLAATKRPNKFNPMTVIVVATVVIGLMCLLLSGRREGQVEVPELPAGVRPAAFNRVAAAAVDFAPALATSMIVFGIADPVELIIRLYQQPTKLEDTLPGLLAVALHAAHTGLCELFTAATLGKLICGCRVTNLRGQPPHVWQVLARNFLKIFEMLLPPFLIWPLVFTHYQRLGDLFARTLVTSTLPTRKEQDPPDDNAEGPFDDIDPSAR